MVSFGPNKLKASHTKRVSSGWLCYNGVTMKLTIHEIAQVIGAKNDWSQLADLSVNKIEFDSRLIEKGDIFGIIGFSGAGKSTLLRMINALEMPTTGYVEIDGVNINSLSFNELRKIRKRIGMVFQQFNLLNAKSVYDNVAIPEVHIHKKEK